MAELSILIPCRNDSKVLTKTVAAVNAVVTHNAMNVETLLIDDESEDETLALAQSLVEMFPALHIRVLARKRLFRGFGAVMRYGLAYANGRFCALVSSDGQDPVELLPQFVNKLRGDAQVVQCSRYLRPEDIAGVRSQFRLYQAIYRRCTKALLGQDISDTTYGFRAFDRIFILSLGMSAQRFNVCPEMTLKTLLCGGKVEYLPGTQGELGQGGQSKFQLPSEILGYAYVLLRAALHRGGFVRWF